MCVCVCGNISSYTRFWTRAFMVKRVISLIYYFASQASRVDFVASFRGYVTSKTISVTLSSG